MPNRIVREAILSSEKMCKLSWAEEVFYRRLMSIVDDHGRFEANPKLLRSRAYPLQTDDVSVKEIEKWLAACSRAGLIMVYAVDDKQYLEISNFGQQVRSASKWPAPPAGAGGCEQLIANEHLGVSVSVSEGVSDVTSAAPTPSRFDEFWASWPSSPRKVGKGKALEHWKRHKLDAQADTIIAHVTTMKRHSQWLTGFEPAVMTYLNQQRWHDGIPPDKAAVAHPSHQRPETPVIPTDWWETASGIEAKARENGLSLDQFDGVFPRLKHALFTKLGDGPWNGRPTH